jgi:hypothetical protein
MMEMVSRKTLLREYKNVLFQLQSTYNGRVSLVLNAHTAIKTQHHFSSLNKKFWEELIRLRPLHKSTVNNLAAVVTMEHNPNPLLSKANLTTLNINNLKLLKLWDYCIEVPLNGITSVPNFLKMYVAVQKLLVGSHRPTKTQTDKDTDRHTYRQTDRQTGDLISLLSFL